AAPTEIYTLSLHDALPISFHGIGVEHLEERGRRERLEYDPPGLEPLEHLVLLLGAQLVEAPPVGALTVAIGLGDTRTIEHRAAGDRKSTRLNSSHVAISYA